MPNLLYFLYLHQFLYNVMPGKLTKSPGKGLNFQFNVSVQTMHDLIIQSPRQGNNFVLYCQFSFSYYTIVYVIYITEDTRAEYVIHYSTVHSTFRYFCLANLIMTVLPFSFLIVLNRPNSVFLFAKILKILCYHPIKCSRISLGDMLGFLFNNHC